MKKNEQGKKFIELQEFAETLGFIIEKWNIKENATGDGCVATLWLSAKDDPEDSAGPSETTL